LPSDPNNRVGNSGSHAATGSPSTPNDIIISHECRAMADKCMRLARTAPNTQQRDELFDAALLLLRVASSYDDALPDLPSVSILVPAIAARTSTDQVLTTDDNVGYRPDEASELIAKTLEALTASSCDDALPDLPSAPKLAPTIAAETSTDQVLTADNDIGYFPDEASKLIAKTLKALPEASTVTCSTAQFAELLSTVWPDTPACTRIERIAKTCQCSWLLVEETGTVSFTKDTSLAKSVVNDGQISGANEENEDAK